MTGENEMKHIDIHNDRIRQARGRFRAMAATYCLGVFNDNFFKQAVLLLSVSAGLSFLQGFAASLFALPFILFSACGGWLADRFSKKKVILGAKALEIVAMIVGAAGLLLGSWSLILAMLFIMGMQSAFFNPALNGAIPELYPRDYVPRANGVIKLVTTLAILAGIACAGISLDQQWIDTAVPFGLVLVALVVVSVAVAGFLTGFGVHGSSSAGVRPPFPWLGPVNSIRDLRKIIVDRQLRWAIIADVFFYFLASLVILTVNVLAIDQLGLSQTSTSLMSMSLMVGICIGAALASKRVLMEDWSRSIPAAAFAMGGGLFLAGVSVLLPVAAQPWWLGASLAGTGIAGGFFLIPVTSFLQVRPADSHKGRVLAAANFCGFTGILCSGFLFNLFDTLLPPAAIMAVLASASLLFSVGALFARTGAGPIAGLLLRRLLSLRYRVEVKGLDALDVEDGKGVLFLPNHPALIDPVIVMSILLSRFRPRPLSDESQASMPVVRQFLRFVDPITLPDLHTSGRKGRNGVKTAIETVVNNLNNGEQILLYPAGRLYRSSQEQLLANSAVQTILDTAVNVQVVLIRTTGLWGSSFSRAGGRAPSLLGNMKKHIWALLASGLFFMPKRTVNVELLRDRRITSLEGRREINSYLENFYNSTVRQNTHVPYFWWQGSTPRVLPEPETIAFNGNIDGVPDSVKRQVLEKLGYIAEKDVKISDHLANDLGIDSLSLMEFVVWLENEFGVGIDDSSSFNTAEDCVLAACGRFSGGGADVEIKEMNQQWFAGDDSPLVFEKGANLVECFFRQFTKDPKKVLFADRISGCRTNRQIVTSLFVLKPLLEKLSGDTIGIMLPPSVSASITYLASLVSGKTPVMLNWTGGIATMDHGLALTETSTVVTARKLYQRIEEQQGMDLSSLPVQWFFLEDVAEDVSLSTKLFAFLKTYLCPRSLCRARISETAAILFTSGSESRPKAVPLTHENIIANMEDFSGLASFSSSDRLLGMLPPFHSLGLVGTIILPLCSGLKTVYHANPTESQLIAGIIDNYKATVTIGTPTFLDGILQSGTKEQLKSLRLVFTGAEKCSAEVFDHLRHAAPGAILCEGYGITECSPLVSLNTPEANATGTVGRVLPSIDYAIIDPEKGVRVEKGRQGILLVRGRSIFGGYLKQEESKGFRSFENRRWYDTGDFVCEDENRNLHFCGRQKRFVKLAGEMISLPAIENALHESFKEDGGEGPRMAVETAGSDGHPEIVLFSTFEVDRQTVNSHLRRSGLSPLHHIRRIEMVTEIPILGSGKTDYQSLKRLLAA